MSGYETIRYEAQGRRATITLARPDRLNSITNTMLRELYDCVRRVADDPEVRVVKLTDPIPNDLLAAREGFPEEIFKRFKGSFDRLLETELGGEIFFDVLSAKGAVPTDDSAYDGFRQALISAGVDAEGLLEAAERRLEERRQQAEASP